jgi:glycosyltransferase involved in cell wall biosynthesis
MYQPKVSVVTVCYNSENTIEQAMLSVLNQSYINIEYIVIDGGSTDATVDVIKKYANRLAYWHSKKDAGVYDAMNEGIRRAKGELLAFLNSDDYYISNDSMQIMVGHFEKNRGADIIAGRIALINPYGIRYAYSDAVDHLEEIAYRMVFDHPAMLVKRKLFVLDGLFDLKFKIAADYEWSLREYCKGRKIVPVSTVVAAFRTGGLSSQATYDMADEVYQIGATRSTTDLSETYHDRIEESYRAKIAFIKRHIAGMKFVETHCKVIQNQLKQLIGEKEVCIWGYGMRGRECHDLLEYFGYHVSLIIDTDQQKWQETKQVSIRGVEALQDFNGMIIISPLNDENHIAAQINEMKRGNVGCVCYSHILSMLE